MDSRMFKVESITDEKIVLIREEGESNIRVFFTLSETLLDRVESDGSLVEVHVEKAPAGSYGHGIYCRHDDDDPMGVHWRRMPDTKGPLGGTVAQKNRCAKVSCRTKHEITIGEWMRPGQIFEEGEEIDLVISLVG